MKGCTKICGNSATTKLGVKLHLLILSQLPPFFCGSVVERLHQDQWQFSYHRTLCKVTPINFNISSATKLVCSGSVVQLPSDLV